jgi:hypothetical protein
MISIIWAVSVTSPVNAQTPMTFFRETDPQKAFAEKLTGGGLVNIYASGEIVDGTADEFIEFVRKNNIGAAMVHLNSAGGSLYEGMKLGRAIRMMEFSTTVGIYQSDYNSDANKNSICASACAYAFAGGTSRYISEYTGSLGIHQFYSKNGAATSGEATQRVSGLIVAYLDEMGIDAKAFTLATIADRNGMIWLTPDTALELRFANNGSAAPTAEIKLLEMKPYLRIEQVHSHSTARVLFFCEEKQITIGFGIVTDEDSSAMIAGNQKRSYLELDDKEFLVVSGSTGGSAVRDVVWLRRNLTPATLRQLIQAQVVSAWIDGFGAVRYGTTLQIGTVRSKISEFVSQCYG